MWSIQVQYCVTGYLPLPATRGRTNIGPAGRFGRCAQFRPWRYTGFFHTRRMLVATSGEKRNFRHKIREWAAKITNFPREPPGGLWIWGLCPQCVDTSGFIFNFSFAGGKLYLTMPIIKNRQFLYVGALLPLFLLLLAGPAPLYAQNIQVKISGMVVDADTKTGLPSVTIINKRTQSGTLSSENGRFYIEAQPGDTIEFSMLSYYKKEVVTPLESTSINVYMPRRIFGLQEVNVRGRNYHQDSLATRAEYGKYFNYKKPGAMDVLKTLPANPVTALSYLMPSKTRKRKEHFRDQLVYWEKEKFIDHRYSPELVQKMTKLESPELDSFMLRYRPGYHFLETATDYDLLLFIKQSFEQYKQAKKEEGEGK